MANPAISNPFRNSSVVLWATGLLVFTCASSVAQGFYAPKVGGASSFDNSTPLSGNSGTAQRRPLTSVAAVPEDFSKLKLSPGFLLSMEVYDAPEFSTDLRVNANGDVTVPMVGSVHIADKTLTEAASLISQQLRTGKILNNPQVALNVVQYAGMSVSMLGEVHNPGRVELLAPRNLSDVLALAGGETQYAGNIIEIRHAVGSSSQKELVHYSRDTKDRVLSNSMVLPGDIVTVRRAGIVYVLGSVNRPGGYVMQEDGELNVSQALSLAYGTTIHAAVGSMRLIRKLPDGTMKEIQIPYREIVKGKMPSPRLEAEDMIYVPVSKVKTILGAGLLATAAQAAIYIH
jgi:polysaccharide biosynthesis/export protein